jgi:hypothetical protein
MTSDSLAPKTMGSPISNSLRPFSNHDLFGSFFTGAVWGGLAVGLLGAGAWLISVMRTRSYIMPTVQRSSEHKEDVLSHFTPH